MVKEYSDHLEKANNELLKMLQLQKENASLRARLEKSVELPVKFGDKIYTINPFKPKEQWRVNCGVVKTIIVTQTKDKKEFAFKISIKYRDGKYYTVGKTAFLDKTQAESRLAELKGEKK